MKMEVILVFINYNISNESKKVLNTCFRFVNNREDAEDLRQEAIL